MLGKSDLMFSLIKLDWKDAEEEFEDLLDALNENGAFQFDKDFLLKAALVLIDKKAQYKVEKFKGEEGDKNLESIRLKWGRIQKSFQYLDDFLVNARITLDSMLPSYNALMPILYFAFKYDSKPDSKKVVRNMQTWLYKVLLNANFSGQSDSIIDSCIDVIKTSSSIDYFPYKEIEAALKTKGRVVSVDKDIIDHNAFLVLNLLYSFNNQIINFQVKLNGNAPQIDHIFPKSKMTYTYKYPSQYVNNIGNYMFLEMSLNIDKTNILPETYFPLAVKEQPNFYERNLIPKDIRFHKPEMFREFVDTRRDLIFETVKTVLKYQE